MTLPPNFWAFVSTGFCTVRHSTVHETFCRATCDHVPSPVFTHNHVFTTNKMEFRDNSLSLRNSLFGVFSQPSIEEGWQKTPAASRESREQGKRLRMPILCLRCSGWCHDAGLCPQTGASRPQAAGARQRRWRGHLPSSPGSKGEARPAGLRRGADGRTPAAPALPAKAELGPAPGRRAAPIALPRPRRAEAPRREERNGAGGQRAQLRCQRRRGGLRPSELLRREEGRGARR